MTARLEVRSLAVSLGRGSSARSVLRGVSFSLDRGELMSIIGRNGAGKSTLCRCIAGLIDPDEGSVLVEGSRISGLSPRAMARLVAYVPQSSPTDAPYTARELLEMSRYPWRGIATAADDRAAVDAAIEISGIGALADRRICEMSGGERQKVMIASAIAQGTPCILMDEPTTYLDCAHQEEASRVITAASRELGAAVVAVTHDINMALRVSDRIIAIDGGRVASDCAPRDLAEGGEDLLSRLFGIRFERYTSGADAVIFAPSPEASA